MMEENGLPKGWVEVTLGEISNISTGFPFKSKKYSDSGELRVVRGENVSLKKLRWDNAKYWNHSTENLEQYLLDEDDIVIGMDGSRIGKNKSSIPTSELPLILAQRVARVKANKNTYQGFLKYCILNEKFERYIIKVQTGTSIPHISLNQIRDYDIIIPERLQEQQSIASILTSFDDKIELLQAQNETLETIAQTIFKEWFGKFHVGDELPEGWRVGKIGDFNAIVTDYVANGSFASLKENVTLYYDIPEYALFIRNTDLKSNFANKVYVDRHSYDFLSKTKLFGGEIIISNVGDVGSVYLCPLLDIPMTLGNNVVMIKSKFNYYLFSLFKSNIGEHLISTITSGSAQQKFNKTEFRNLDIIVPSNKVLLEFENTAESLYNKISCNNSHIQTLQATRDTLLPKLMSGQLRVAEFQEQLSEVM